MVHRCTECTDNIKTFLGEELSEIDEEEEIQLNKWQRTDRSQLITQTHRSQLTTQYIVFTLGEYK